MLMKYPVKLLGDNRLVLKNKTNAGGGVALVIMGSLVFNAKCLVPELSLGLCESCLPN